MKELYVSQVPPKKMAHDLLLNGQVNTLFMNFRMKIDTLSELHEQLLHHEYKDRYTLS